jgi:hypothetical protein
LEEPTMVERGKNKMKNKKGDKIKPNALSQCNFFAKNSKGQFFLMATIIIIGLIIGLVVIFNYSTKSNSYQAEEIAKGLSIESEKVLDYDSIHSSNEFENFARDYSSYAGEDKEIYFIIVDGADREAYKYSEGVKIPLNGYLVVGSNIQFTLDSKIYSFKLENGKNFYFILVYNKGGEKYVFSG